MTDIEIGMDFVSSRCDKLIVIEALAKINLTLDITGTLPNGYHTVESVMQPVSLTDTVIVGIREYGTGVEIICTNPDVPTNHENLAAIAYEEFFKYTGRDKEAVLIYIEKNIPICAGLAGGSANAAATIKALNHLLDTKLSIKQMEILGTKIGVDVPFCIREKTVFASGFGEVMADVPPMPFCHLVIVKPKEGMCTSQAFLEIDSVKISKRPSRTAMLTALGKQDIKMVASELANVFEYVVLPDSISKIKSSFKRLGALGSQLTGTGTAVYAIFEEEEKAKAAAAQFIKSDMQSFLCAPV